MTEQTQTAPDAKPAESKKAAAEKSAPKPNIVFVGTRRRLNKKTGEVTARKLGPEEVPTLRVDGGMRFELPDGKTQLAGFYHEHADRLQKAFPRDFKPLVHKGGKQ